VKTEIEKNKLRQEISALSYERMLKKLMGFDPCERLSVGDVKFLAEMCRTETYQAMCDYEHDRGE